MNVYLDHGATSFPKAPGVVEQMSHYLNHIGCNINRGAYGSSFEAENIVYETRELIGELFHFKRSENIVFTKNITESLNVLLKGMLSEKDHVIVSSMEHNAVMRPLHAMRVEYTKVPCTSLGELNLKEIKKYIKSNTKAIIMLHASNVCGTILPLEEVGKICKENKLLFIVDTAQTAGFLDIDYEKLGADAIAFTGHKGLLGPQGIGGFLISDDMVNKVNSFIQGGTGSLSEYEEQPLYMPDKFEAGTMNIPGIYGFHAALEYILDYKIENIRKKEIELLDRFMEGVGNMPHLQIVGKKDLKNRTSVISLDVKDLDQGEVAYNLYKEFGIMIRCGLHCSPSAHQTLKTFPKGTMRFSFGHKNTKKEVDYAVESLYKCIKKSYT
ncbi:aminotransferase class V-fold PLP-dependent enzyme [Inediibacterium massiliense]|uniref:aminotransferase class V-fold PLP-dependent enzyme n=1 Tax=Inediibacterium massiliense TaxID=1658111 RepID=UPI000B1D1BD4|nr:aminotransferase class V-fold PLP-dependent enzyme [Inediibacterium massiliense]